MIDMKRNELTQAGTIRTIHNGLTIGVYPQVSITVLESWYQLLFVTHLMFSESILNSGTQTHCNCSWNREVIFDSYSMTKLLHNSHLTFYPVSSSWMLFLWMQMKVCKMVCHQNKETVIILMKSLWISTLNIHMTTV